MPNSTTILMLSLFAPLAFSTTLVVGPKGVPCQNPGYNTIQSAVTAANPGDTIYICPALYSEQVLVTKPLTLVGIAQQNVNRVLVQPAALTTVSSFGFVAVITVANTTGVTISNIAVDASNNNVSACTPGLSGIHFYNASGVLDGVAVSGARLSVPTSCTTLFPGNGAGVQADGNTGTSPSNITVQNSSIHDFGRNGVLVIGPGEQVNIVGNAIAGVGPSYGVNQFGVFLANGATGKVTGNNITQGHCGSMGINDCFNMRSEGVVLRSSGNGVLVENNVINNVQAGVFVNVATGAIITGNLISNVDALSAIHLQGAVSNQVIANRISHVGPFSFDTANNEEGCGVNDISGSNSSQNFIQGNWIMIRTRACAM